MNQKVIKSVLFISLLVFTSGLFVKNIAQADTPFGGRMYSVIFECECEPCKLVYIGAPKGGRFMYCTPYRLYDHRKPNTTRWQLGMAGSNRTCHEYVCDPYCSCESRGSGKQVIMVGTSLY